MQPTNSEKPTELKMWWPDPSAFDDLTVEDAEHGFDLSAPDDTECGVWLSYWNQDEEHHKFFEAEFTKVLIDYAENTLEKHGQTKAVSDEQACDRTETEEVGAGALS